jgi:hypothetical protein
LINNTRNNKKGGYNMSGEARDKQLREGRLESMMKSSVDDSLGSWRQQQGKPGLHGRYNEVYNFGSPKAKWRTQVFKFGPLAAGTGAIRTVSGSIPASATHHLKVEAITIMVSGALSSSVYIDKIGLSGVGIPTDIDYFYSSSSEPLLSFVSASGRAILAHPGRAGTADHASGAIHNAGWHTSSANVTVQFQNDVGNLTVMATDVGDLYMYVYCDNIFKAFE